MRNVDVISEDLRRIASGLDDVNTASSLLYYLYFKEQYINKIWNIKYLN